MLALTEALEIILNWLQMNYLEVASFPYRGLISEQIEQLVPQGGIQNSKFKIQNE
ncbi:MAG: hypothetical protein V7L27_02265 [Nostoc sp.]|uniref:hypothetical protein n=1 Tax=Nostoc sp. TaxID=1180 RepID=UPI002FF90CA3